MANGVAQLIYSIGRKRGATPKEIKSALETGIVESHLQNLPGGTGDSAGWRQERKSLYPNPTDLEASINRYFDETRAVRGKYGTAGALAAAVQRPAAQYRGRYQQHSADADALLRSLGGDGSGGGGGSRVGSSPASVTVTTGTAQNGFDPGPQQVGSLAGLLTQQAPPPVAIPQAPNAVIQSPVVSPPPVRGGLADALAAIQTPAQGLPETDTTPTKVSVKGGPRASTASLPVAHGKSKLLEMFYNGAGGINVKNGQREPRGFVSGHTDHVHVAAGPKTVVALGNLAEQMGLHVGENPHFGTVHPVHTNGSYHYKGEAIDVSGTPAQMERYNRKVASLYGLAR